MINSSRQHKPWIVPAAVVAASVSLLPHAAAESWEPVPIVPPRVLEAGVTPGGEGCQMIQALAVEPRFGRFLLMGTDVGGIYRSVDGGRRWEAANRGYASRGAVSIAMDPHNPERAIVIGGNSRQHEANGVYVTEDAGASWRQTLSDRATGFKQYREQVAFDPATFDEGENLTRVVYWSTSTDQQKKRDDEHPSSFYKSTDGGLTWGEIPGSPAAESWVKVAPSGGVVYAANARGFFRSEDGGLGFERILDEPMQGLDVVPGLGDAVFAVSSDRVWVSRDRGKSFASHRVKGIDDPNLRMLKVSPADPRRMVAESVVQEGSGPELRAKVYSQDGGRTWGESAEDYTLSVIPANRDKPHSFAWHGSEHRVWSVGGDFITRSRDGGQRFEWANNGYNGILVGGGFHFNPHHPGLLAFASQDYNGALTEDSGRTWRYVNYSGLGWGGFVYGGYAASPEVVFAGLAKWWHKDIELVVSHDGGQTFARTGHELEGQPSSLSDPADASTLFAFEYRSGDNGRTWSPMDGCTAVLTASAADRGLLFGRNDDDQVVESSDGGLSWRVVATLDGNARDAAYDARRDRLWVVTWGERLCTVDRTSGVVQDVTDALPVDAYDRRHLTSVAVDPVEPDVVYVAAWSGLYSPDTSSVRSTDGGDTWEVLTAAARFPGSEAYGNAAVTTDFVRVHPQTREAWFSTGCQGIWKIGPPEP